MENFNAVNDAQGEVVDTNITADDTIEGAQAEEQVQSDEGAGEVVTPRQNAETNAAFAQMRRNMEQAQRERDEANRRMSDITRRLQGAGYTGTAESAVEQIQAEQMGLTVAQMRAREQEQSEAIKNSPEYKRLQNELNASVQRETQRRFEDDLAEIKRAYPDEKAQSVAELGEQFMRLRANGVDNMTAYRAIADGRKPTPPPAEIGKVGASGKDEKTYYTSEELDALTPEQLKNERVYKKAMRSLTRLK